MKYDLIYIEKSCINDKNTQIVLNNIKYNKIIPISSVKKDLRIINFSINPKKQKNHLIISKNKTAFIKKCIRDKENILKNEYFIKLFSGCPMECAYCYLQDYLETNINIIYINKNDLFAQLKTFLNTSEKILLHTGEICDSFAVEKILPYISGLISLFENKKNKILEIRSKTTPPNYFYNINGFRNIHITQTISPQEDIDKYEKYTASLAKRIEVLRKSHNAGFSIGIRLDPIIYSQNLEEKYEKLFSIIHSELNFKNISSISVGALRFTKELYKKLKIYHSDKDLFSQEYILSEGNKLKYIHPIRGTIHSVLAKLIKKFASPKTKVIILMDKKFAKKYYNNYEPSLI